MMMLWSSSISERAFAALCLTVTAIPLLCLLLLLGDAVLVVLPHLSGGPGHGALLLPALHQALVGSLRLIGTTALFAVPVGMGVALYLEEYRRPGLLSLLIERSISVLAGVPSVIFGLLGLEIFVLGLRLSSGLLVAALTLALLVLPLIVVSSREALRTVPAMIRDGGHALGASRFQVVTRLVLPMALPGMLAGAFLALSRALGEAAPLLVVGSLAHAAVDPGGVMAPYAALPSHLFSLTVELGEAPLAAACLLVLVATVFAAHVLGLLVRRRAQQEAL